MLTSLFNKVTGLISSVIVTKSAGIFNIDITPDVEFSKVKKKLKGKGVSVTENLTEKRMEARKKAREDDGSLKKEFFIKM